MKERRIQGGRILNKSSCGGIKLHSASSAVAPDPQLSPPHANLHEES